MDTLAGRASPIATITVWNGMHAAVEVLAPAFVVHCPISSAPPKLVREQFYDRHNRSKPSRCAFWILDLADVFAGLVAYNARLQYRGGQFAGDGQVARCVVHRYSVGHQRLCADLCVPPTRVRQLCRSLWAKEVH